MSIRSWPNHQASALVEPRVNMDVNIDNHYQSKIYTTSSTVSGHVRMNPSHDVQFEKVQILLLGTSKTRVDAINVSQATSHTFLKLMMPIPDSHYPSPRRFQAGTTYTIPFHFVIPQHLTLNACNHRVPHDALQEDHLRLPPSFGDWDKEDFTPHMSRVSYCVRARVHHQDAEGKSTNVAEATRDIKVIPMAAEDAPLNITKQDKMYTMSKCKTLRKSILSPKLGKLTVSANQPAPAMISSDGHDIDSTTALIDMVFEPTSNESQPPKIVAVTSKITAISYYSAGGINQYPNLKDWVRSFGGDGRGSYASSVQLPGTPVDNATWKQHLTSKVRRDSGYSSEVHSDPDHSPNSQQNPTSGHENWRRNKGVPFYYATKVQVPVQLPANKKQFVPTFHSCIASRVYVLWMTVTLSALAGTSSTIAVSVPLQIGAGPRGGGRVDSTGLPNFEAAMQEAALEVDAYLQPRTMAVPDIEFASELPGYSVPKSTQSA
ncbi:putative arrestin protein [Rosellinia necatrix]|uniref:Putative arrestin protein n=1 Tax=Rosellinia necatrix TaxID=77044 RepID=A0A1W2TH04_ROSNE|nr:putative arrestin protein [Rosellinia necatrix]